MAEDANDRKRASVYGKEKELYKLCITETVRPSSPERSLFVKWRLSEHLLRLLFSCLRREHFSRNCYSDVECTYRLRMHVSLWLWT